MSLKKCIALFICIMPFNAVRIFLYNFLLGYHISPTTKIGLLTVISVDAFVTGQECVIGRLNRFWGAFTCKLGNHIHIGSENEFSCGEWVLEERFISHQYARALVIDDYVMISRQHYFDMTGKITIGQGTWIAGKGSDFWTHGINVKDRDITIGKRCYIGARTLFSPGSMIGDDNIIGLGSTLTKKWGVTKQLIAGVPAEPIKDISLELSEGTYAFNIDMPDETD